VLELLPETPLRAAKQLANEHSAVCCPHDESECALSVESFEGDSGVRRAGLLGSKPGTEMLEVAEIGDY
jgi:hypothetical protein